MRKKNLAIYILLLGTLTWPMLSSCGHEEVTTATAADQSKTTDQAGPDKTAALEETVVMEETAAPVDFCCECAEVELPSMIRIEGALYYDCAERRDPSAKTAGSMGGRIRSWIAGSVPFEDNMANVGCGFDWQYGGEDEIDVLMDDGWHIFRKYRKGMNAAADAHIHDYIEAPAELPAYDYDRISGSRRDPKTAAIIDYIFGLGWFDVPRGGVMIPAFCTFLTEEIDEDTVKVYGNFWTFVYERHGETLFNTAGGENPGVFTLKRNSKKADEDENIAADEYTVIEFDRVGDGSYYSKDIDRICAGNTELKTQYYEAANGGGDFVSGARLTGIAAYVKANALDITAYQDFGWDPVLLLEAWRFDRDDIK